MPASIRRLLPRHISLHAVGLPPLDAFSASGPTDTRHCRFLTALTRGCSQLTLNRTQSRFLTRGCSQPAAAWHSEPSWRRRSSPLPLAPASLAHLGLVCVVSRDPLSSWQLALFIYACRSFTSPAGIRSLFGDDGDRVLAYLRRRWAVRARAELVDSRKASGGGGGSAACNPARAHDTSARKKPGGSAHKKPRTRPRARYLRVPTHQQHKGLHRLMQRHVLFGACSHTQSPKRYRF